MDQDNSPQISAEEMLSRSQIIYEFTDLFANHESSSRDYYFSGGVYTMVEVQTLCAIKADPGCTLTQLAASRRRSKCFISQVINKLDRGELIIKTPDTVDSKKKHLFISEAGEQLCKKHELSNLEAFNIIHDHLLKDCTPEEIAAFYKVMRIYNNRMAGHSR